MRGRVVATSTHGRPIEDVAFEWFQYMGFEEKTGQKLKRDVVYKLCRKNMAPVSTGWGSSGSGRGCALLEASIYWKCSIGSKYILEANGE